METRKARRAMEKITERLSSSKKKSRKSRRANIQPSVLFQESEGTQGPAYGPSQEFESIEESSGLGYDAIIKDALVVCGLQDQVAVKLAQALETVEGIASMCQGDGSKFSKFIAAFFKNNYKDQVVCGTTTNMRIEALGQVCKDTFRRGSMELSVNQVTVDSLRAASLQLVYESDTLKAMNSVAKPPVVKLKQLCWIEWRKQFEAYLRTQLGVCGGPLLYVIIDDSFNVFTDQDQLIQDMFKAKDQPQLAPYFRQDAHQIKKILSDCLLNTEFDTLIDRHSDDGSIMWSRLVIRCEGLHDAKVYLQEFVAGSKKLIYKSESVMTFNDYINKWEKLFHKASLAELELTDAQKIIWVTGNMYPDNNTAMHQALTTVISRDEFENDYHGMIYYFNNLISSEKQASKQSRKKINVDSATTKGQDSKSANVNGQGKLTKPTVSSGGVDVSNPSRFFTKEDWAKLPDEWKKYCIKTKRQMRKKGTSEQPESTNGGGSKLSKKTWKKISQIVATSVKDSFSQLQKDTKDDPSTVQSVRQGRISGIESMKRSVSSVAHSHKPAFGHVARTDLDSHADTCVLGKNFLVIEYTNQSCDVRGFANTSEHRQVPIVTGATAFVRPDTGENVILIVNQALYLGEHVEQSLLNPNQIRFDGNQVQDDPTKPRLGITTEDGMFISMQQYGTLIGMMSYCPTFQEYESLERYTLTGLETWDPHNVKFEVNSMKRKNLYEDELNVKRFRINSNGRWSSRIDFNNESWDGPYRSDDYVDIAAALSRKLADFPDEVDRCYVGSGPDYPPTFLVDESDSE